MLLAGSWMAFSHFPCYPQAKWALLVLIPMWIGLCMFWDPVGLSNYLSCEAGRLSHCHLNPQGVFNQWFEALFPRAGALGCAVCCRVCQLLPRRPAALVLQPRPCRTSSPSSCVSLPLLPAWMNVSSLTPWLSDFHTV